MEYAAGGELFERICTAGRFSEDEARYFFQQLISGVSYCHAMQICHRENTLLDGSPAPRLKICDFGYSKVCGIYPQHGPYLLISFVGTSSVFCSLSLHLTPDFKTFSVTAHLRGTTKLSSNVLRGFQNTIDGVATANQTRSQSI